MTITTGYQEVAGAGRFFAMTRRLSHFENLSDDWTWVGDEDAATAADSAAIAAYLSPMTVDQLDAIATAQSVTWTGTPTKSEKVLQLIEALHAAI